MALKTCCTAGSSSLLWDRSTTLYMENRDYYHESRMLKQWSWGYIRILYLSLGQSASSSMSSAVVSLLWATWRVERTGSCCRFSSLARQLFERFRVSSCWRWPMFSIRLIKFWCKYLQEKSTHIVSSTKRSPFEVMHTITMRMLQCMYLICASIT